MKSFEQILTVVELKQLNVPSDDFIAECVIPLDHVFEPDIVAIRETIGEHTKNIRVSFHINAVNHEHTYMERFMTRSGIGLSLSQKDAFKQIHTRWNHKATISEYNVFHHAFTQKAQAYVEDVSPTYPCMGNYVFGLNL